MKTSQTIRHLSLFAILSVLGATAHAAASDQPQQLAENGSERTIERNDNFRTKQALKLAEGGSERTLERSDKAARARQELAENGSQRALDQAEKSREKRAQQVAEGGSDRLLAWHAARTA
jgi:hypothetical protein